MMYLLKTYKESSSGWVLSDVTAHDNKETCIKMAKITCLNRLNNWARIHFNMDKRIEQETNFIKILQSSNDIDEISRTSSILIKIVFEILPLEIIKSEDLESIINRQVEELEKRVSELENMLAVKGIIE